MADYTKNNYDISPLLVCSDIPVPVKIARDAQIFVLDITKLNILICLTYQLYYCGRSI